MILVLDKPRTSARNHHQCRLLASRPALIAAGRFRYIKRGARSLLMYSLEALPQAEDEYMNTRRRPKRDAQLASMSSIFRKVVVFQRTSCLRYAKSTGRQTPSIPGISPRQTKRIISKIPWLGSQFQHANPNWIADNGDLLTGTAPSQVACSQSVTMNCIALAIMLGVRHFAHHLHPHHSSLFILLPKDRKHNQHNREDEEEASRNGADDVAN